MLGARHGTEGVGDRTAKQIALEGLKDDSRFIGSIGDRTVYAPSGNPPGTSDKVMMKGFCCSASKCLCPCPNEAAAADFSV